MMPTMRVALRNSTALLLVLGSAAVAGCSSGSGSGVSPTPGTGGAAASGGSSGVDAAPAMDATGSGGAVGGGSGGSSGSGDDAAGIDAGTGIDAVAAGDGGGFWGPNGPRKQFSCPAGPFPAQTMGASTDICVGFKWSGNWNEGPTWIASEGAFFFSNFMIYTPTGGDIIKYTPGGDCEVWLQNVGCNGLGVSPSGNLLAACHGPRAVMEYDVKTKAGRKVATMVNGKMFDAPNDLIARSDGNVYFSNRTAENGNRPIGLGQALVRIDPMGNTSVIQMGGLNGVALSPDETKLYVVEMGTWTLDAAGVPGQKGGPTPGGDGIAVDCADRITNNGTNSAYGGPDGKTLLVVGQGTRARTVAVTVPGLP